MEKILNHSRVSRRNARAQAIWCPSKKLAEIIVVTKGLLENFGSHSKNGITLFPEEMCFLVEMNKLEVTKNEIPLSIQDCYGIVTETVGCKLYRAYRMLAQHGYKLLRYEEFLRKKKLNNADLKHNLGKEKTVNNVEGCSKKLLRDETTNEHQLELIKSVFEKIKKVAPSQQTPVEPKVENIHYVIFLPNNKYKKGISCDYQLIVCDGGLLESVVPAGHNIIYAICSDSVSFYQAAAVDIPFCDYI